MCFSIEAILDPVNPVPWAGEHRRVLQGCEASADGRTATVRFQRIVPSPRDWLGVAILPSHAFESTTIPPDHPFSTEAFGSLGMRASLREDRVLFDHPGGERPKIPHFELRSDLSLADVLSGRAHGMVRAPRLAWEAIRQEDEFALKTYDTRDVWFVAVRREGALAELEGRVALDVAIDRDALREALWGPPEMAWGPDLLSGPYRQSSPYYNRTVRVRPHDPAPLQGIGPLRLGVGAEQEGLVPGMAEAVADQLRDRGIEVEVVRLAGDPLEPGTDRSAFDDLDLMLVRWVGARPDHVRPIFAVDGTHNPFGVHDEATDRLLVELERARTDTEYQDAAHALHRVAFEQVHALWLVGGVQRSVWSNGVRNNSIAPGTYWTSFGAWKLDPSILER